MSAAVTQIQLTKIITNTNFHGTDTFFMPHHGTEIEKCTQPFQKYGFITDLVERCEQISSLLTFLTNNFCTNKANWIPKTV
jgi:hypothetical protein